MLCPKDRRHCSGVTFEARTRSANDHRPATAAQPVVGGGGMPPLARRCGLVLFARNAEMAANRRVRPMLIGA